MTPVRFASLIGVEVLVLALNVAMSFLYMVVYGYLINPGHPKEYYDEHIKVAAPYCSLVAGIPLMFLAALWVGGWAWGEGDQIKAALVVWLAYAVIDLGIVLAAGAMTTKIALLCTVSLLAKLGAAWLGALVAGHYAAQSAPPGPA